LAPEYFERYLLFGDDDPPRGEALEDGAFIEEVEECPLNTTLLLPSAVLMIKFSLGIHWSILQRGKV